MQKHHMIPGGLAKIYAAALFAASLRNREEEAIQGELDGVRRLLELNPDFNNFVLSPQVPTEDKLSLMDGVLTGKCEKLLVNFLKLLVRKERFEIVEDIARAYTALYEKRLGILEVEVITAVPLDGVMERKTVENLEENTKKKIRLTKSIDKTIIGGMVIKMENKIIDGSVKYQLEKLRSNLKEIKVY